jgi:hypothetical protein
MAAIHQKSVPCCGNLERYFKLFTEVASKMQTRIFLECCDRHDFYDLVDIRLLWFSCPLFEFSEVVASEVLLTTLLQHRRTCKRTGHAPDACLALWRKLCPFSTRQRMNKGVENLDRQHSANRSSSKLGFEAVFLAFGRNLSGDAAPGICRHLRLDNSSPTDCWAIVIPLRRLSKCFVARVGTRIVTLDGHWLTISGAMWLRPQF